MSKREGKIWIEGMENVLADETLAATDIREKLGNRTSVNVLPDVWVIKIGGQSIMDRGREAVHPILEELRAASAHPSKVLMMRSFACIPFLPAMVLALCLPSSALAEVLQITSQYTGQINGVPIEATGTGQMDTTGNSVNCMEIEFQSIPDSIHPFALGNCWNSTYHKNAVLPLGGALNLWSLTGEEGNYIAGRTVRWSSLPGDEIEIIADVTTQGGVMTADQVVNGTYSGPTDLIGVTDYEAIWTQIDPTTVELSVTATILRANGESFEADITQVYSGLSVQMPTDQQFSTLTFSDHTYSNNILSICWQGTVTPRLTPPIPGPEKAPFIIKNKANPNPTKRSLKWVLTRFSDTTVADFGDPTDPSDAGYTLSVVDETDPNMPVLILPELTAPGGPFWKKRSTGFKYRDKNGSHDGIQLIRLRARGARGARGPDRGAITFKAKGSNLPIPNLPLPPDPKVSVTLCRGIGRCWAIEYTGAIKNTSEILKLKMP